MKIFLFAFVSVLMFTALSAKSLWLNDYTQALELAKQKNKDIYLYIGADSCKFCRRYDEVTLSKKHVIDRLQEEYILLYLSRDQHKIPKGYSSEGVPRHYFITKNEKLLFQTFGMPEPEGLFLILDEVELNKED